MIEIAGTELIADVCSESEQRIRDVFEQAEWSASRIMFFLIAIWIAALFHN